MQPKFEQCVVVGKSKDAGQRDLSVHVFQPVLKVLHVLDLGENLLGNKGIQLIREPLMVNSSVFQLGLAQVNITCEGTTAHSVGNDK